MRCYKLEKKLFDRFKDIIDRFPQKKIIIWGAAVKGKCLIEWLARFGLKDRILFFVDSDECIQGKSYKGYLIKSPNVLKEENNSVVFIASSYSEDIIKELKVISPQIEYVDVCEYCLPSKIKEIVSIYSCRNFYVVGYGSNYSEEIAYLSNYGCNIVGQCKPEETINDKSTNNMYVIVDRNHLEIENILLKKGFRNNKDYIVMTEFFKEDYHYTLDGRNIKNFDRGRLGDKNLKDFFCPLPFTQLYYYDFRSDICSPTWNNDINVGNPQEMNIGEIWNSNVAKKIRASIIDGSFRYCNDEICWRMLEGKLFKRNEIENEKWIQIIENDITEIEGGPEFLNIGYNATCNLHCKMCRDGSVFVNPRVKEKAIDNLKKYNFKNLKRLIIPGNGELFANNDYLDILLNIEDYKFPNLEAIWIYSNGVLFTEENWEKIEFLTNKYKMKIFISTDSVCRETFMKIRRGGDYEKFMNNLKMLAAKRHEGRFDKLYLPFCVQRENFREMDDFIYFAKNIGADCVHFEKIFNCDISESVHRPENVYYNDFINVLNKAIETGRKIGIEVEVKPFTNMIRSGVK